MKSVEIEDALRKKGICHLAMVMFITSINLPDELSGNELAERREFVSCRLFQVLAVDRYILYELISDAQ